MKNILLSEFCQCKKIMNIRYDLYEQPKKLFIHAFYSTQIWKRNDQFDPDKMLNDEGVKMIKELQKILPYVSHFILLYYVRVC